MTDVEAVASRRISVLCELRENPTPELQAEFERLNQRMNELCPRVYPDQFKALKRTLDVLESARNEMDELDRLIADSLNPKC